MCRPMRLWNLRKCCWHFNFFLCVEQSDDPIIEDGKDDNNDDDKEEDED